MGYYKEVINLINIFKARKLQFNETVSVLLEDCLINSYEGLDEYEKCLKFIPLLKQATNKTENLHGIINQYEHIVEIFLNNLFYKEATQEFLTFLKFIDDHKEVFNENSEYYKESFYIKLLGLKIKFVNLENKKDTDELFQDFLRLIGILIDQFGQFDSLVIEAKAWLANIISTVDEKAAVYIYQDVFSSLATIQFSPSVFMLIIKTIANFFTAHNNIKQANELLKFGLLFCENRFGNEHGLTSKIRDKISANNKCLSEKDDNTELLFALEQKGNLNVDFISMIKD